MRRPILLASFLLLTVIKAKVIRGLDESNAPALRRRQDGNGDEGNGDNNNNNNGDDGNDGNDNGSSNNGGNAGGDDNDFQSTCGYLTGDSTKPRTANNGYHCSLDSIYALWGFCSNDTDDVADCGFVGRCTDSFSCTAGCGRADTDEIFATSCGGGTNSVCSTDILINNADSYTYVACGQGSGNTFYALPLSVSATTTTSSSSSTSTRSSSTPKTTSVPSTTMSTTTTTTSTSTTTSASTSTTANITSTTARTSPSSTSTPTASSSGLSVGAAVGGTLGGLALVCATALGIMVLRKKSSDNKTLEDAHNSATPPASTWRGEWAAETDPPASTWRGEWAAEANAPLRPVSIAKSAPSLRPASTANYAYTAYKPPEVPELYDRDLYLAPVELEDLMHCSQQTSRSASAAGEHEV